MYISQMTREEMARCTDDELQCIARLGKHHMRWHDERMMALAEMGMRVAAAMGRPLPVSSSEARRVAYANADATQRKLWE